MAPASSKSNKRTHLNAPHQRYGSASADGANSSPEAVEPIWLLKAVGLTIAAALVCGYLSFCLLFYQGQWQFVLHPDRSKPAPASIAGDRVEIVHFSPDDSGAPQLTGWWLPASPSGRYAAQTILFLPQGDGSLADAVPTLAALHSLGLNLFALNYRGYGQSAAIHPDERRMEEDALSAWQYLTGSRHISGARILPFGCGVGATLAVHLAFTQAEIPAVVLQFPSMDVLKAVQNDPRTRLLPVRALFHERFDMSLELRTLRMPKLFLLAEDSAAMNLARLASDPKSIAAIPASQADGAAPLEEISRFLDQVPRNR